tara:strand:- start:251 stop:667 length:417 start_codon:yes stop_codon:yes gene_type:complete
LAIDARGHAHRTAFADTTEGPAAAKVLVRLAIAIAVSIVAIIGSAESLTRDAFVDEIAIDTASDTVSSADALSADNALIYGVFIDLLIAVIVEAIADVRPIAIIASRNAALAIWVTDKTVRADIEARPIILLMTLVGP